MVPHCGATVQDAKEKSWKISYLGEHQINTTAVHFNFSSQYSAADAEEAVMLFLANKKFRTSYRKFNNLLFNFHNKRIYAVICFSLSANRNLI